MGKAKYNTQSLRDGIAHAKRNIQALERAIEKERQTIRDYKCHIAYNEEREAKEAEVASKVVVEVEREEDPAA